MAGDAAAAARGAPASDDGRSTARKLPRASEGDEGWDSLPSKRIVRWKTSLHPAVMDAVVRCGAGVEWSVVLLPDGERRLGVRKEAYMHWYELVWAFVRQGDQGMWRDSAEDDWVNDRGRSAAKLWESRQQCLLALRGKTGGEGGLAGDAITEDVMLFDQFCAGLVELADRWTSTAKPGEAVVFLSELCEALNAPRCSADIDDGV
jgi:hypothetical protein